MWCAEPSERKSRLHLHSRWKVHLHFPNRNPSPRFVSLTISQMAKFRLFQTKRVCRRQFRIRWKWQKVLEMGKKHCGKRRNCLLRAISPFPTVFSKDLYCKHIKARACLGKFVFFIVPQKKCFVGMLESACLSICVSICVQNTSNFVWQTPTVLLQLYLSFAHTLITNWSFARCNSEVSTPPGWGVISPWT